MALKACHECQNQISTQATVCPKCGAPSTPEPKHVGPVGIVVALVFGAFVFHSCSRSNEAKPPADPVAESGAAARLACRQFVERKGYKSEAWGEYWNWTLVKNSDGTVSVGARFMGAAPGGVTRNLYVTCVMRQSGDNWSLESLARLQ